MTAVFGAKRRAEAEDYYRQALTIARRHRLVPLALDVFVGLAQMLLQAGDGETAVALLALAEKDPAAQHHTRRRAADLLAQAGADVSPKVMHTVTAQLPTWLEAADMVL